ncbi:hypothetical protein AA0616_0523 [Komagataeibacter nataicola NRIC 0616]|nr:hypothetical protein AA0616_0523 [Komagataeibacter nataicola NRIC 0616]
MEWAYEHRDPLDWTLHLSVYDWLAQSPLAGKLTKQVCREVRAVAAAQWAALDRSSFLGIAIAHSSDPTWTVAFKARNVHLVRSIEEINIGSPPSPPENGFGYFLIPSWDLETFPGWTLLNNAASQN